MTSVFSHRLSSSGSVQFHLQPAEAFSLHFHKFLCLSSQEEVSPFHLLSTLLLCPFMVSTVFLSKLTLTLFTAGGLRSVDFNHRTNPRLRRNLTSKDGGSLHLLSWGLHSSSSFTSDRRHWMAARPAPAESAPSGSIKLIARPGFSFLAASRVPVGDD